MDRHDPRQRGEPADEAPEVVVEAGHADTDRQLGVEIARLLRLRLEQLEDQTRGETGLGDVDEQRGDLGLIRELAQHGPEGLLHLGQLLAVGVQIGGPLLLGLEGGLQLRLAPLLLFQSLDLALGVEVVPAEADGGDDQGDRDPLDQGRPFTIVVEVEIIEIDVQIHSLPEPLAG